MGGEPSVEFQIGSQRKNPAAVLFIHAGMHSSKLGAAPFPRRRVGIFQNQRSGNIAPTLCRDSY
jgi:hypothetical protein